MAINRPTTREDSQAGGWYQYWPGTTCARGHVDSPHWMETGECVRCTFERSEETMLRRATALAEMHRTSKLPAKERETHDG